MPAPSTLIAVSAFSGLAGALLTQVIAAVNGYYTDKRKQAAELGNQFRSKKVEIAESFYFMTGEKMAIVKKNIRYWKNWNTSRSEASIRYLNGEMRKLNSYLEKLDAENWKYNLVSLYFNVSLTNAETIELNARTHRQFLKVSDCTDALRAAKEGDREPLLQAYAVAVFDLCALYEAAYEKMQQDMETVKEQLLRDFAAR